MLPFHLLRFYVGNEGGSFAVCIQAPSPDCNPYHNCLCAVSTAAFMPRAVASKVAGQPEGGAQPKSNDDFRKLLLSGKKQ